MAVNVSIGLFNCLVSGFFFHLIFSGLIRSWFGLIPAWCGAGFECLFYHSSFPEWFFATSVIWLFIHCVRGRLFLTYLCGFSFIVFRSGFLAVYFRSDCVFLLPFSLSGCFFAACFWPNCVAFHSLLLRCGFFPGLF